MKFTQKYIRITTVVIGLIAFNSCADRFKNELDYPNDVTFNELTLGRFTFDVPDAPFIAPSSESGEITVNVSKNADGSYSGFALSNKNSRSYPWDLSPTFAPSGGLSPEQVEASIDSTAFSVYTGASVNRTENFLVGNTNDDNAFFTLSSPTVVEHVLVANTTYNALLAFYGSIYSKDLDADTQMYTLGGDPRPNPNIANPDPNREGVFTLPGLDGTLNTIKLTGHQELEKRAAGEVARDEFIQNNPASTEEEQQDVYDAAYESVIIGDVTLTIEGFLNGNSVGSLDVYLSVLKGVDADNPDYAYTVTDWRRVELSSFGEVDKVLFNMSSSYVNTDGTMVYPSTFCLDGIRLK